MLFYAFIYAKLKYFVKVGWKLAHNFWCKFKTEEILQTQLYIFIKGLEAG